MTVASGYVGRTVRYTEAYIRLRSPGWREYCEAKRGVVLGRNKAGRLVVQWGGTVTTQAIPHDWLEVDPDALKATVALDVEEALALIGAAKRDKLHGAGVVDKASRKLRVAIDELLDTKVG